MAKVVQRHQTTSRSIKLVPPLAKEFSIYGSPEIMERARKWALRNRLVLVEGAPTCAHGMYGLQICPTLVDCHNFGLDHTQLWMEGDPGPDLQRPFLLTQPYVEDIPDKLRAYAGAHGLNVSSYPQDDWYGNGTLPIRLEVDDGTPLLPIELEVYPHLVAYPIAWPDDDEEDWGPSF